MSKKEYVEIEAVREALEQVIKSETEIERVLNLLNDLAVAVDTSVSPEDLTTTINEGEDDKAPKPKMQHVILVSDPSGIINKDLTGWVLKIPENEDCREVVESIKKGAYNYNDSKKGAKYPVSSIGQAIEGVGSGFFKPYNVRIVTKEAVWVVTTDNNLPKG